MPPPPSIFSFIDYREFMRAWITHRRSVQPDYSYAVFAEESGLSRGTLPNVLSKARSPRPETLDAFATAMSLSPSERNYLGKLVEIDAADSVTRRWELLAELFSRRAYGQSERIEDRPSAFERFTSRWYYGAIRELAQHPDFRPDPEWIAKVLIPSISVEDAREALDTLADLDMLEVDDRGRAHTRTRWVQTAAETDAEASHRFHSEIVPFVARHFDAVPEGERHLTGGLVLLSEAAMPEAKLLLQQVVERIATIGGDPTVRDRRVYHFAIQLVPVTRSIG